MFIPGEDINLIHIFEQDFGKKVQVKLFERSSPSNHDSKIQFIQLSFSSKEDMESYEKLKRGNKQFKIAGRPAVVIKKDYQRSRSYLQWTMWNFHELFFSRSCYVLNAFVLYYLYCLNVFLGTTCKTQKLFFGTKRFKSYFLH